MTGLNVPVNQWENWVVADYASGSPAPPNYGGGEKQTKHYRKPLASVPQKGIMFVR
jgi:hypothetical protein